MKERKRIKLALMAILLVALVLRLCYAQGRSVLINCDELISASTVAGFPVYGEMPINTVFTTGDLIHRNIQDRLIQCARSGDNGNSYFFNLVLSFWVNGFGLSDLSFRTFMTLFDCLTILLLFMLGMRCKINYSSVLFACTLVCVSPLFFMFGGGFVRTYGFTTCFVLGATLSFLKAYDEPGITRNYIAFLFLSLAAFFGHFLVYYIFIALFLFALLKRKKNPTFFKRIFLTFLVFGVISIALLLLNKAGVDAMQKSSSNYHAAVELTSPENMFNVKNVILYVSQYFFSFYTGVFSMVQFAEALGLSIIPFVYYFVLFLFPIVLFLLQRRKIIEEERLLLPWLLVIFANISALGMMFAAKHFISLDVRYSLFSVPFFYLLMTQVDLKKRIQVIFLGLYFAVIILSTIGTFNRYASKPIDMKVEYMHRKPFINDIDELKAYFSQQLKTLDKNKLLHFNNINDYVFFTLITNGAVRNPCIIDQQFPSGVTAEGFKIEFSYHGDCG